MMTRRIIDLALVTCSISVAWFVLSAVVHQMLDRPAAPDLFRDALGVFILLVGSGTIGGYLVSTWRYSD